MKTVKVPKTLISIIDNDASPTSSSSQTSQGARISSDFLYHILISQSHLSESPKHPTATAHICGTYTSLPAAKAAAQRALFSAGYESEWLTEFDVRDDQLPPEMRGRGVVVYAASAIGILIEVSILTTPNLKGWEGNILEKVQGELYHVVQTTIDCNCDKDREHKDLNIVGTYQTYDEAWRAAKLCLLDQDDGITKKSFTQYDEAQAGKNNCRFSENTVVCAVGENGISYQVDVVKGQEMAVARLAEAI